MNALDEFKIQQSGRWCRRIVGENADYYYDQNMPYNATRVQHGNTVIEPGPNVVVVLEADFVTMCAQLDDWRGRVAGEESSKARIGVLEAQCAMLVNVCKTVRSQLQTLMDILPVHTTAEPAPAVGIDGRLL
jgi:hypothetical protein